MSVHAIGVLAIGGDGALGTRVVMTGGSPLETSVIVSETGLSYAVAAADVFPTLVRAALLLSTKKQKHEADHVRAVDADVAAMGECF